MAFERLKEIAQKHWGFEVIAIQILVLILLVQTQSNGSDPSISPIVGFIDADIARFSSDRGEGEEWQEFNIYDAPAPEGTAWVDWIIPNAEFERPGPLAISMQGPFSAAVFFNGVEIGRKGVPGSGPRLETAGPIDAIFAIPEYLVQPTGNRLAMRYSANRAGYKPAVIIQSLYVRSYRADARRDLRYYTPALIFSGGLIAAALGMLQLARVRKDKRLNWLVVGIFALTVSIAAEVSRSVINYPYDWHQTRQAFVGVGFVLFGTAILRFATLRWPAPGQLGLVSLVSGISLAVIAWTIGSGYDAKIIFANIGLFSSILTWTIWRGVAADHNAIIFGLSLIGFPLLAIASPGDFLDRGAYIMGVSVFGYALLRTPQLLSPNIEPAIETPRPAMFSVRTGGRCVFIPIDDITLLKAAGNYTEIHKGDNQWELENRGLSAIAGELPKEFFRVHRSYTVNLAAAESLKTQEGSRYWLVLRSGEKIPVSRNRVKDLRAAMMEYSTERPNS